MHVLPMPPCATMLVAAWQWASAISDRPYIREMQRKGGAGWRVGQRILLFYYTQKATVAGLLLMQLNALWLINLLKFRTCKCGFWQRC